MRGKVTKRRVDTLKADPKADVFLWDNELRGFGVRVKPSGATAFIVAYYAPGLHRVRRRLTLGAYGALTPEQARSKAVAVLARVANGADPAVEKAEGRRAAAEDTVDRLFKEYKDDGVGRRKPRTMEFYESLGDLHLLPALGKLPITKVTPRDVADLHRSLRKKPVTANRVVRLVRSFFYWLERRGLVSGKNPASGIEWFPEQARERFLTVEEMARLGEALRVAERVGLPPAPEHEEELEKKKTRRKKRERNAGMFKSELRPASPAAVSALRFLMLTGWREMEALTLKWTDVDLSRGSAMLEDTKSGRSARPLSAPARELLDRQPRIEGTPYVFPGRDPTKPIRETQRLWYAARAHAGLRDVRLHDLRHSVASFAGARGHSLFLIGKLLGHKDQRSTQRYAHLADDIRQTMADDVAEGIREAMDTQPVVQKVAVEGGASPKAARARFKK
jgi:integrase